MPNQSTEVSSFAAELIAKLARVSTGVKACVMVPAAQAADPPELATLEELGAFHRLHHRGVHLSDNARTLLAQVPLRLRVAAVELAASSGEASCPLCGLALNDNPEQRISHLWLHGGGDIDDDGGPRSGATKTAFSVSASTLGK